VSTSFDPCRTRTEHTSVKISEVHSLRPVHLQSGILWCNAILIRLNVLTSRRVDVNVHEHSGLIRF